MSRVTSNRLKDQGESDKACQYHVKTNRYLSETRQDAVLTITIVTEYDSTLDPSLSK